MSTVTYSAIKSYTDGKQNTDGIVEGHEQDNKIEVKTQKNGGQDELHVGKNECLERVTKL